MGSMPAKYFLGFPVYRLDQTMYEDNAKNGQKYEASWFIDQSFNMQSSQG